MKECTCSNSMVSRYQSDPQASAVSLRRTQGKLGPAADRAALRSDNIHMDVPQVEAGSASRTKSCRMSGWARPRTCSGRTGAIQARVDADLKDRMRGSGNGSALGIRD